MRSTIALCFFVAGGFLGYQWGIPEEPKPPPNVVWIPAMFLQPGDRVWVKNRWQIVEKVDKVLSVRWGSNGHWCEVRDE